jgi:putative transposase
MHSELGGASKTLNCPPIIVGGVEDHIHLLARQSRVISLSDWVKELKRVTSIWIKAQSAQFDSFAWQAGYAAFSVSQSQSGRVSKYIKQQEQHHQKIDFKSELLGFLDRHEIEYDERYLWQ